MLEKINNIINKPLWKDYRFLLGLWVFIALAAAVSQLNHHNNYLIFCGVFNHLREQISLFSQYPDEYFDSNHYGPLFSIIIAPFAILPDWLGLILWCIALALLLFWAIRHSDFTNRQQIFMLWFCAHELLTALQMQQFNVATVALILHTYFFIEKEKDSWAALCIVIGTLVKLYGIVGLAFFFFSKHKMKFIAMMLVWTIVLFALPMLISSPEYVMGQYKEWYESLVNKNGENLESIAQNISLLGMVRRISGCNDYSDIWIILGGMILFAVPYLRFSQYKYKGFRETLLASVLMFIILFSTGSESSGYIIPFIGVVIWYTTCPWKRTKYDIALMVFVFILSSMSPSDLFPAYLRKEWVQPYALKALPVFLVWMKLCYEMIFKNYNTLETK